MTTEEYVQETGKSRITSFVLTLLFGPLGLLYSSVVGGIIMIILAITLGAATAGAGAIVIWIVSIIMGDSFTYNYNKRLLAQSNFMKDISGATAKTDNEETVHYNFKKEIGKILTYNSETGKGVLLLSNNKKIDFDIYMWKDPKFLPEIGMTELNVYNKDGVLAVMSKNFKLEKFEEKLKKEKQ